MLETIKAKAILWFLEGLEKDGLRRKVVVNITAKKLNETMGVKMKSWKTTVFGLVGAVGGYLATVKDPSWLAVAGQVLAALGVAGIGMAARDNDKSSEQVGAK